MKTILIILLISLPTFIFSEGVMYKSLNREFTRMSLSSDGKDLIIGVKEKIYLINLESKTISKLSNEKLFSPYYTDNPSIYVSTTKSKEFDEIRNKIFYIFQYPEIADGICLLDHNKIITKFEVSGFCSCPVYINSLKSFIFIQTNDNKDLLNLNYRIKEPTFDIYKSDFNGNNLVKLTTFNSIYIYDLFYSKNDNCIYFSLFNDIEYKECSFIKYDLTNNKFTKLYSYIYGEIGFGLDSSGKYLIKFEDKGNDKKLGDHILTNISFNNNERIIGNIRYFDLKQEYSIVNLIGNEQEKKYLFILKARSGRYGEKSFYNIYIYDSSENSFNEILINLKDGKIQYKEPSFLKNPFW